MAGKEEAEKIKQAGLQFLGSLSVWLKRLRLAAEIVGALALIGCGIYFYSTWQAGKKADAEIRRLQAEASVSRGTISRLESERKPIENKIVVSKAEAAKADIEIATNATKENLQAQVTRYKFIVSAQDDLLGNYRQAEVNWKSLELTLRGEANAERAKGDQKALGIAVGVGTAALVVGTIAGVLIRGAISQGK